MRRKQIVAFCLYDFGDSAFAVLFPFVYGTYYAEKVVGGERGAGWWGAVGSVSMLAVALSAPLLGGIADHAGVRKRMLVLFTLLGVAASLSFAGIAPGFVVLGFLAGVLANFAFEGGIVFYNAYLPIIAPPSHHGRISAAGFAVGYVGSLLAIGGAALLRDWTLIWVAMGLQWLLFALPALFLLPADRPTGKGILAAAREGLRGTLSTWRDVLGMKDLRRFLIAYFFYMDGVNTVILFAGLYAAREFAFTTGELLLLIALVQVTALLGSIAMAKPTDVKGPKWSVRVMLLWWIFVVGAAYFATNRTLFWCVAVLAGLGVGCIQASSRAFMSRMVPRGREAEMFGFYALCGKSGAILGPFLFGQIGQAFGSLRPAILSVAVFYVVGYLLLGRVRLPAPSAQAPA